MDTREMLVSAAKIIKDLLETPDGDSVRESARAWLADFEESQRPPRLVTIPDVSDVPANSPRGPTSPDDLWLVYGEDGDDLLLEATNTNTRGSLYLVHLGEGPHGGMTLRMPKSRVREFQQGQGQGA